MSIDPVHATTASDLHAMQRHDVPARPAGARPRPAPVADSGMQPTRDSRVPQLEIKSFELPRDAVQVQRDAQNQIVIKYLDGSGRVIFQVPSSQILALQHSIEQALEEQAQSRLAASAHHALGEGGIRNGH
jgi:hypothetical protein